eukprot:1192234-Rhodomonas_salina.1
MGAGGVLVDVVAEGGPVVPRLPPDVYHLPRPCLLTAPHTCPHAQTHTHTLALAHTHTSRTQSHVGRRVPHRRSLPGTARGPGSSIRRQYWRWGRGPVGG